MHSVLQQVPSDRYVVFHGGTRYRRDPEKFNNLFNDIVDVTLIQTADLLDRGAHNEHWVIPPVETDVLQPHYTDHIPRLFGHFPKTSRSIPDIKGTSVVEQVLQETGVAYRLDTSLVPWDVNMQRIREVDVYIEECAPPYEFGMTSLEAAALGKVVVTDSRHQDLYIQRYTKDCPLMIANTKESLQKILTKIHMLHASDFREIQEQSRCWVEETHSLEAVGRRLQEILCG